MKNRHRDRLVSSVGELRHLLDIVWDMGGHSQYHVEGTRFRVIVCGSSSATERWWAELDKRLQAYTGDGNGEDV